MTEKITNVRLSDLMAWTAADLVGEAHPLQKIADDICRDPEVDRIIAEIGREQAIKNLEAGLAKLEQRRILRESNPAGNA